MTIKSATLVTTGITFAVIRSTMRSTVSLFGRDFDMELRCKVSDFKRWQFGYEGQGDKFNTCEYWFGPLYFLTNKL